MLSEAVINLGIVGITCFLLVLYLIRFVFRYKHEYESNPLCTTAVVVCLLVVLLTVFVLPVDIFLVSFIKNPNGALKEWVTVELLGQIDDSIFAAYYSLYGIITFLIFVVIPFLYFFIGDTESNSNDRFFKAVKYTFGFAVFMSVVLIVGALTSSEKLDPNSIFSKITRIYNMTKTQDALNMIMATMTLAGFVNAIFYTASGIVSWPIGLLLGTSSVADRVRSLNDREVALRVRINALQEKARTSRLSPTEQQQLSEAENELRDLERDEIALTGYSSSLTYRMRKFIRPLQIFTGSLFGLLALYLLVTLILVNLDRILHGAGPKQGYVLLHPTFFNPLDYVYTKLNSLVFIGPMPLLMITCFLVVATISGVRNLGLWFIFARLYRIKVRRTQPEALLFFCTSIMLTALSFNLILYSMTSEYVTFGGQNYLITGPNNTEITNPCTLEDIQEGCVLTRSSILLMRMMSQVWIVGAIFYWMSWFFVAVGTLSFLGYLVRGRRDATHGITVDNDEFED